MSSPTEIISEQITIAIMGPQTFPLLQILLSKDLSLVNLPKLSNKYITNLFNLYPQSQDLSQSLPTTFPKNSPIKKLQKYTTYLQTQSLWLQFNFIYMGHIALDPLLADITKGPISICIVADYEQETVGIEWKSMLTSPNCSQPPFHPPSPLRTQLLIQQTLLNSLNSPCPKLATYKSLLSLKVIDKNRIIEGTNNIKTNRYQILRWIVDRHFENTYEVKLRAEIGDEVENYVAKGKKGFCNVM